MSRIEGMVERLCPGGVPVKTLGEVGTFIRGNGMAKTDLADEGFPAIHYGEIHRHYGTSAIETHSFVNPDIAVRLRKAEPGDLVIATTSEDDEGVGKAVAWLGQSEAAVSGDAYIYRHELDPMYAAYLFQSRSFHSQKRRSVNGTKVRRISGDKLAQIQFPVPPREIQEEIVSILELFQSLEMSLQTELSRELVARQQQYGYYRSQLLASGSTRSGWATARLGDVAEILIGFPFKSSAFTNGSSDVRLVRGDNIGQGALKTNDFKRWKRAPTDLLDRYELRADDIVLAMDRPWIPAGLKWARIESDVLPALLVQRVACLRGRAEVLDQAFLSSVVSSAGFTEQVLGAQTGNTVPHLSGGAIANFSIPLPPLPEQVRIASELRTFGDCAHNLCVGLGDEVKARRTQYDFYRDRMLEFEGATA